jgi:L-asparaginase II
MEPFGDRVFVKTGAEGVFCGAIPGAGLGVAIKIDDGAARASGVRDGRRDRALRSLDDEDRAALDRLLRPALRNWNGIEVGAIAPAQ